MSTPTRPAKHAEIGGRIRSIREGKKMRQIDLASAAGMSWRHLIRMERGEGGEPKRETLDGIAAALGVDRSELTGADDDEEPEADMVAVLLPSAALRRLIREELAGRA